MRTTGKNAAEELTRLGKQWDNAIQHNDVLKMEKFMAADCVILGTEGGITSKPDFLDYIRSGDLVHNKMDFEDIRVEVYENTGIVTSRGTSSGTYKGEQFSYYEWSTNVYVKSDGRWMCVHTMLTPAQRQPS